MKYLVFAVSCWLLAATNVALAAKPAPPPNDNLADAIDVPANVNILYGPTANGTKQHGEPDFSPAVPVRNSIWWKFTAQHTGLVVLTGWQQAKNQYFVDVFKNNSFELNNRIATALAERHSDSAVLKYIIRLAFNVEAGKTYHIRAGGLPLFGPASYEPIVSLNIRRLPVGGGTFVVSDQTSVGLITAPIASGIPQSGLYIQPHLLMIGNATSLARTVDVSSTMLDPFAGFVIGSPTLPAMSGGKPGVSFVSLQSIIAHRNQVGHWTGSMTLTLSSSAAPIRYSYVYDLYRTAPVITSVKLQFDQPKVTARFNGTTHLIGEVTNTGRFTAHDCNLQFQGAAVGVTWHAMGPDKPASQPFSIAPNHSRKVELVLHPLLVGSNILYVMASCSETNPYQRGASTQVHVTGTR